MAEVVTVRIPTALRPLAGAQASIEVAGSTVHEVLRQLVERHPELGRRLFKEEGRLNGFVNIFLNEEDVRFLQALQTAVSPGDTVSIIPAIAGGRPAPAPGS
jgi:MoaD family protein